MIASAAGGRDPDLLDDEPDKIARYGAWLITAVALLVSAEMLVVLAQAAGWKGNAGYALPILLDVAGGLGGRVAYRRQRTRPSTRRYAKRIMYGALVASCLGNLVGHLIQTGSYHPGPELVIAMAFVAPIVAAAVLHLSLLLSPTRQTTPAAVPVHADQTGTTTPEKPASEPADKPGSQPARTTPDRVDEAGPDRAERTVVPDDEAVQRIRELDAAAGEPVSERAIRAELNCGAARAKKLAEQARTIHLAARPVAFRRVLP